MSKREEIKTRLLQLLDRIEEEAQVDFLGTGSNSQAAEDNEAEWRGLFHEAKALIGKL